MTAIAFEPGRDSQFALPHLTPIAAACAVLLASLAGGVHAQQADTAKPDSAQARPDAAKSSDAKPQPATVVVTGIRRGIEDAIALKRDNSSIVEAISSEDIGKLPDPSIAESIARLPGVTAQRTNGEAQAVSVRGMSPDFTGALLNGREQTSTGDSRSVYFSQYPAELIHAAVIYKTPDAGLVGQGLAGTIDLHTVRPLDYGERTMAASYRKEKIGKGLAVEGSGNRASVSYIDQFFGRKLGVALGFARQHGDSGATTKFSNYGSGTTLYNGTKVNIPFKGFDAETDNINQTRDGAIAVIEFRPTRAFTSVLDLLYSQFDITTRKNMLQVNMADTANTAYDKAGVLTTAVLDGSSVVSGTFNNVHAVVRNESIIDNEKLKSLGWRNTLLLNSDWKVGADLNHSTAERLERDREIYAGTVGGAYDSFSFDTSNGGRKFTGGLNYADPAIIKITDVQGWAGGPVTPQAGYSKGPNVNDKINALRLNATRTFDNSLFSSLDLGVNYSDRSKERHVHEYLLQADGGPFGFVNAPASATTAMAGDTGIPILSFDALGEIPGLNFVEKRVPGIWNKDWSVYEKILTTMAKLNLDTRVGSIPVSGNLGLQLLQVKQSSTAYSVNTDGGTSNLNRPVIQFTQGKDYHDLLPSMNLRADLGNQQTLRFALAKIEARPTMNDMRASNSFGVNLQKGIYSGSGGNPKLEPFRAKGADLSYEKYYDKHAYFSAAAFYKKIDTYIANITDTQFDFTSAIQETTIKLPTNIGEYTRPTNGSGGSIKGIELAASLPFNMVHRWLDGFGVATNFSNTLSSLNVANTAGGSGSTMPLPGLSRKVASLTLYYENHGFSFRVAERYRSDFVGEVIGFGGDRTMTFIKGEKLIDTQAGYEFASGWFKGASLIATMSNVTDTPFIRYQRNTDGTTHEVEHTRYGKRMMVGLNFRI